MVIAVAFQQIVPKRHARPFGDSQVEIRWTMAPWPQETSEGQAVFVWVGGAKPHQMEKEGTCGRTLERDRPVVKSCLLRNIGQDQRMADKFRLAKRLQFH